MSEEEIALIRHSLRLTFNHYYQRTPDEAEKYRALARRLKEIIAAPCPKLEMGQFACVDRSQCWEPCGDLGHSEEHVCASRILP